MTADGVRGIHTHHSPPLRICFSVAHEVGNYSFTLIKSNGTLLTPEK